MRALTKTVSFLALLSVHTVVIYFLVVLDEMEVLFPDLSSEVGGGDRVRVQMHSPFEWYLMHTSSLAFPIGNLYPSRHAMLKNLPNRSVTLSWGSMSLLVNVSP